MNISIRHLKAFVTLASLRNFGLAAKEVGISQPALSQAINKMEKTLGYTLIDRSTRSVELTPIALALLPRLTQNLREIEDLLSDISIFEQGFSGQVSISCLSSIAVNILPSIILECQQAHPLLRVHIQEDNSTGVENRVISGQAEIGICSGSSNHDRLSFSPFVEDKLGVVLPRQHVLADKKEIQWSELQPVRLVLMSAETGLPKLINHPSNQGVNLNKVTCIASHFGTITAFINKGLGIGILPSIAWPKYDDPHLKAIPLINPVITREIGLIRLRGRTLSPGALILSKMLQEKIKITTP